MKIQIVAGDRIVDGSGSLKESEKVLRSAVKHELKISTLEIVTLAKRWEDKLKTREFKSGASAMAAIERAKKLLRSKTADVVVIHGRDDLKTGYERGTREGFMKLYKKKYTPLEGYDRLVPLFLRARGVSKADYFTIRNALFENYTRTYRSLSPSAPLPDARWFEPLTTYFRGVDCANPNVDYEGQIVVMSEATANRLKIAKKKRIEVAGNAFTKLAVDGFESLPKIAPYLHLKRTIDRALKEARVNFKEEFLHHRALLDAYTCYPVVPMGLIHRLGLVEKLTEIPELLRDYEVTVTGGLNLGKAAWNLTSLNALIVMREKLLSSRKVKLGLVHGNGSLGNQQGITILRS